MKQCPKCKDPNIKGPHTITTKVPSIRTLERMVVDEIPVKATDGCKVEPDGKCSHGHNSWLVRLGYM